MALSEIDAAVIVHASTLVGTDAGRDLATSLANTDAGRQLAASLANTDAGLELARSLANTDAGLELARSLAATDAGLELATSLANTVAGRELARSFAATDAGQALATSLTYATTGLELANSLANTVAGRELARSFANTVAGRDLARSLADTAAGRELAGSLADTYATDAGQALAVSLANTDTGRQLAGSLTRTDAGLYLANSLASSYANTVAGRDLAASLAETDAGRALAASLANTVAGGDSGIGMALAGSVVVQFQLLLGVVAGVAAVVVFVAAVATQEDEDAGPDEAGLLEVELGGGSFRRVFSIDVGQSASLGEISQVLADLSTLTGAAVAWAQLERDLGAAEQGDGGVDVLSPVRTISGLGDDPIRVESITYTNPVEVILAGGAALGGLAALLGAVQHWRRRGDLVSAEVERTSAESVKARAEARKFVAEAEREELENEIYKHLLANKDNFRSSPEMVLQLVREGEGVLDAFVRLSLYEITTRELPSVEDTDPDSP